MDFSPQTVRNAGFKTVKKGYDPAEVDAFKEKVAASIEAAQNQATAMEARARAAVAKLQEVSQQAPSGSKDPSSAAPEEDVETISRTLLLAQRTADSTIAQANTDAEAITDKARIDATAVTDDARATADKMVEEARLEARRSAESELIKAENEVQALLARRDFLLSDVDHLEQHLGTQRERLRDAAVSLQDLVERVPGGLGDLRRPLLSASAATGEPPAATAAQGGDADEAAESEAPSADDEAEAADDETDAVDDTPISRSGDGDDADGMRLEGEPERASVTPGRSSSPAWSASGNDPLIGGEELR